MTTVSKPGPPANSVRAHGPVSKPVPGPNLKPEASPGDGAGDHGSESTVRDPIWLSQSDRDLVQSPTRWV